MASIKPEVLADPAALLLPPPVGQDTTAAEMRTKLRSLLDRARGAKPPLAPPINQPDAHRGLTGPGEAYNRHYTHHYDHRREDGRFPVYSDAHDAHYRAPEEEDAYSHGLEDDTRAHYRYHTQDTHTDRRDYEDYTHNGHYHDEQVNDYPPQYVDTDRGLLPTPSQTCTCPTHGPQWSPSAPPPPPPSIYRPEPVHDPFVYEDAYSRSLLPSPRSYSHHHHHPHYHHSAPHPVVIPSGTHSRSSSSPEDRRPPLDADYHDGNRSVYDAKHSNSYNDEDEADDGGDYRHARLRVAVKSEPDLRTLLTPRATAPDVHTPSKRPIPPSPTASSTSSAATSHSTKKRAKTSAPSAIYKPVATLAEFEDGELFSDFPHMAHVLIPSNASAALLDRRGAAVQSIAKLSRCTLSIRDRFEDVQGDADELQAELSDMRLLRVYGKPSGVCLALRLAIECVREFRALKGDPYYAPMTRELMLPLPDASAPRATVQSVENRSGSTDTTQPSEDDTLEVTPLSEAEPDGPVQLRWLVLKEQVGRLMGFKGDILTKIRRNTGAFIHVTETGAMGLRTNERTVVIEGTRESVLAAQKAIQARAGGRSESRGGSGNVKMGQYFAIPYHTAGFLIGERGSRAKAIAARTGARLQIPSQLWLPLGSVNRIVHLQGTRKQIDHAVRVMSAKLRDYLAGEGDMDDGDVGDEEKTARREEYDGEDDEGGAGEHNEDDDPVTIRVLVTTRVAARLLDAKGRLVREIMRKSDAYLRFLEGDPSRSRRANGSDKSRVCLLSGDMPRVLRALRLLLQVEASDAQTKPKRLARNVPRAGKRKRVEEAVDDKEEQQPPLDESHELPTKRPRPVRASNGFNPSRSTPRPARRLNGDTGAGRGGRGGRGERRRVQVVGGGGSKPQRPVLEIRRS